MKQYIREIVDLLGKDKKKLPWILSLFLLSSILDVLGLGLIGPYIALVVNPELLSNDYLIKFIEISGLSNKHEKIIIYLGFVLVLIFYIKTVSYIFITKIISIFSYSQQVKLRSFLMDAYQKMPYENHLKRNSSDSLNAIIHFTGAYKTTIQSGLKLSGECIVGFIILLMLATVNITVLVFLLAILGGTTFIFNRLSRNRIYKFGEIVNDSGALMVKGIQEGLDGFKEIRILGNENYFHNIVNKFAKINADNTSKTEVISSIPRYLLESILITFIVAAVVVTIFYGNSVQSLIPTLGMFGVAAVRLMPSASLISNNLIELNYNRNAISNLYNDVRDISKKAYKKETFNNDSIENQSLRNFCLKNVSFYYDNSKIPALNNISIEIKAGESIGFIGISGAGKTTLVDLLLGLLDPQEGEILYNGKKLSDCLLNWRSQVAYLPQEIFLVDDSIRKNIALGKEDFEIDETLLLDSIKQAQLSEFVDHSPKGLDTLIGEKGTKLSGGQRQRVALARSFYFSRNVLVLDEATSALDDDTESEIIKEIKKFKGEKTIIIIAHRLGTVKHCDRIYRLGDGSILQKGTFQEVVSPRINLKNSQN